MNHLDLFSGLGGFAIAAQRVGFHTVAFCEIDKFARRVLAHHWPEVPCFEDVRKLTAESLHAVGVERVGLLSAGFPCQDLSVAGKRAGLAGGRSGLFWEIVRLADTLRPDWLVLENVPGLLSSNGGADMATVIGALADLGYLGGWRVLDAQWFGVAQRRRRVFFVGCAGVERLGAVLPFLESGNGYPAPSRTQGQRTTGTLEASLGRSRGAGTPVPSLVSPSLRAKSNDPHRADMAAYVPYRMRDLSASTLKSRDHKDATDLVVAHALTAEGFDASEDGTGRGPPLVAFNHQSGGRCQIGPQEELAHTVQRCQGQAVMMPAVAIQEAQTGVRDYPTAGTLRADAPGTQPCGSLVAFGVSNDPTPKIGSGVMPTLQAKEGGGGNSEAVSLGSSVRRLTPTEAERLQAFSQRDEHGEWQDGWTCLCGRNRGRSWPAEGACVCPDGPRYKALGNAVCVSVVEWVLGHVAPARSGR